MLRMKTLKNLNLLLIFILILCLVRISFTAEQLKIPRVELPIVVTTCGQSPGGLMISVLSKRINLQIDRADLLNADQLKTKAEEDNPYQTLIITTGTSRKGMGAAGTDMDNELLRIKAVIEEAKRQGMVIIGAHIEGMARRADETDNASIEAVIPESNLLIVRHDGNEDGYFTKLSEEHGIPIIEFETNLEIVDILKELLNIE